MIYFNFNFRHIQTKTSPEKPFGISREFASRFLDEPRAKTVETLLLFFP